MRADRVVPIALVDDHTLVRKGLVELIEQIGGYHVAVQASNGAELIAALGNDPAVELAIIDLNMPIMNGFETIFWLRDRFPRIRSIALTFAGPDEVVLRAMRAGARGFLLKDIEPVDLKFALDQVMETGWYHPELTGRGQANAPDSTLAFHEQRKILLNALTPRELEFLKHVCDVDELTYDEIAERMDVQLTTLQGYRERLFKKYCMRSKTGLVLFAIRWGLVLP